MHRLHSALCCMQRVRNCVGYRNMHSWSSEGKLRYLYEIKLPLWISSQCFNKKKTTTLQAYQVVYRFWIRKVRCLSMIRACSNDYCGVFKKVAPFKTFWNILNSLKSFCVKFCQFVGSSYPHIFSNFWRFILIFHQMELIFPRVPIVFTLSSFE